MFGENFLSDFLSSLLITSIISVLGIGGYKIYIDKKHTKKIEIDASQKNLKQKNITGKNLIQNIKTQNIYHQHYHQYYADPKKIPPLPIKDTSVTGTVDKFTEASKEEIEAAGDAWIQNQIDQERGK